MSRYPGALDTAVEAEIAARTPGSLRQGSAALTAQYRKGGGSDGQDLASYLAVRLPATFAVCQHIFAEIARRIPDFAPATLADVGAGPGTASWAALGQWPDVTAATQVESSEAFAALAKALNGASDVLALQSAQIEKLDARHWQPAKTYDLVAAAYVLAELPLQQAAGVASRLWKAASGVLVLVEPGTPDGFHRVLAARKAVLEQGAHVLGPCTHSLACPMAGTDWCHFKQRLQRSRLHMQVKQAAVPFEDESYSWLAVSRQPVALPPGRIIGPPWQNKTGIDLRVCAAGEVRTLHVASRDKASYKSHRKLQWGDPLPEGT